MLTIATINVQNKYKLKNYNGLFDGEDHVKMLLDLIKKYKLDIIGLQEVNPRYYDRLKKDLNSNYTCHGKSRYQRNIFTRNITPLETFNESVPIITCKEVLEQKTKHLPWLSSYVPRIVTIIEVNTKEIGPIVVLNTHLDYMKNKTKVKQLKYLLKIIKTIKKPVILMGDFNMTTKNTDFKSFIESMRKLKIDHVQIKEKTFKEAKSNDAIDHIFLSNCFQVEKITLEKGKEYKHFSDHYPIILKLNLGFSKK